MDKFNTEIIINQLKESTEESTITWEIIEQCKTIKEFTESYENYLAEDSTKFISRT